MLSPELSSPMCRDHWLQVSHGAGVLLRQEEEPPCHHHYQAAGGQEVESEHRRSARDMAPRGGQGASSGASAGLQMVRRWGVMGGPLRCWGSRRDRERGEGQEPGRGADIRDPTGCRKWGQEQTGAPERPLGQERGMERPERQQWGGEGQEWAAPGTWGLGCWHRSRLHGSKKRAVQVLPRDSGRGSGGAVGG